MGNFDEEHRIINRPCVIIGTKMALVGQHTGTDFVDAKYPYFKDYGRRMAAGSI